ncbi:hypothetical protein BC830DRAFT_1081273 [Chytriomyces sp. MP71]|nr:hypothetical protein BC830DRAFT_1081273 [Chytriomyces sp. MP71]
MGGGLSKQRAVAPAAPITEESKKRSQLQTLSIGDPIESSVSAPNSAFPDPVPEASKRKKQSQSLKPKTVPAKASALVVVESTLQNTIENVESSAPTQQIHNIDNATIYPPYFGMDPADNESAPHQPQELSPQPLDHATPSDTENTLSLEEAKKSAMIATSESNPLLDNIKLDTAMRSNFVAVEDTPSTSLQIDASDRPPPKTMGAFGGDEELEPVVGIRGLLAKKKKPTEDVMVIKSEVKSHNSTISDLKRMGSMESIELFEASCLENAVLTAPGFTSDVTSPKKTTTNPVQSEDIHPFGFFE